MIYDCFTFFNELDLLELRFEYLYSKVDWFVICESPKTHSGIDKPLHFHINRNRYKKYHDKIIHIVANDFPVFENSWTYENYQRNAMINGLRNCIDSDVILISDLDEIPRLDKIPVKIKEGHVYCFLQEMYFYYVNNYKESQIIWEGGTKAVIYKTIKNDLLSERYVIYNNNTFSKKLNRGSTLTKIRLYRNLRLINNGGWHLSYMGGAKLIQAKLSATSHQEINDKSKNSESFIKNCLEKGVDLLDPTVKCRVVNSRHFPDIFAKILPEEYFLLKNENAINLKYYLLRACEVATIHIRNVVRKYAPFVKRG